MSITKEDLEKMVKAIDIEIEPFIQEYSKGIYLITGSNKFKILTNAKEAEMCKKALDKELEDYNIEK